MKIHVHQTAGGRPLAPSDGIAGNHRWPQWSPDGSRIAFTAWLGSGQSEIYVVPALGGVPRRLIQARAGEFVSGIAWSPGGTDIAYFLGHEIGSPGEIYVRSV